MSEGFGARVAAVGGRTLVAAALLAAMASASAVPTFIGTRAQVGAGATVVNWGGFGAEPTAVSNGSTLSGVTVSGSSASFTVLSGSTYNADFNAADNVLALFNLSSGEPVAGTIRLAFATPVYAAGAQVQANAFGSFSGTLQAFGAGNVLLASAAVSGSNGGNGNGSAAFAGFTSTLPEITALVYTGFGAGAAINQLSLLPVPEPASTLMWLAGAGVLGWRLRRAR